HILPKKTVQLTQKAIEKAYSLKKVELQVKYPDVPFESIPIDTYMENLLARMSEENPLCWCLLTDCTAHYREGVLTIFLACGGEDLLGTEKCKHMLEQMIFHDFEAPIKVELTGNVVSEEQKALYLEQKVNQEALESQRMSDAQPKKEVLATVTGKVLPDGVIWGKEIKSKPTDIREVSAESGVVTVTGEMFSLQDREIKGNRHVLTLYLTDHQCSVTAKMICTKDKYEKIFPALEEVRDSRGAKGLKVRGDARFDKFADDLVISMYDISTIAITQRTDNAENKRVELHLHTQMSAMDAVSSATDLIKRAAAWGHKAIAITDHGVAQAYPDAMNTAAKLDIKIIYGLECYLVDDFMSIVDNVKEWPLAGEYVVFDIETTGLRTTDDAITEIGAVRVKDGKILDSFSTFVNPQIPIPYKITELTGITDQMVKNAPPIAEVLPQFLEFCGDAVLVAHNAKFDVGFINAAANRLGVPFAPCYLDTVKLCRELFPELKRHRLNVVAKHLHISLENHHRASDDAKATAEIFIHCIGMLAQQNVVTLHELNTVFKDKKNIKNMDSYHAVILTKNQEGLKNLYRLISASHLHYFYKRPRILKSLYNSLKEGLIIGSACEAGELYQAMLNGKSEQEIESVSDFYDYYEIQPLKNNQFLIEQGKVADVEQLKAFNKRIVAMGEKHNKLVVATCDVHFLDPHEEVYRRILMAGQGFKDADNQAPLYFRTTDEMLAEFRYLGEKQAYAVVVENTNKIADMMDDVRPIPKGTYPPHMDGAEEEIRTMSNQTAEAIYGSPLPEVVQARLDKELTSIIQNGFSVLYMIAQKLVKKSLDDGYLVGSRGSVGSSFVAFLIGITEVNALPPHYVCASCKHSEFVLDGSVGCGGDMPNGKCPQCGSVYQKDGHDIPFETFLGFNGDKAPDIDLNFSGEYQSKAHKYTEVLFGEEFVFRAGTIGTVAEKTAFGYVKKYFTERNQMATNAEIERLVKGCTGVKRTTGQHPGGIIVVPNDNDIHNFTPVQHPADNTDTDIITTHFDYHAIHDQLLKLDILGHDDPTVIKMLEDLTSTDARIIPIDDPQTMSLFTSTKALGVTPQDINSEVGTFAIPEFGTKFVRQMLVDTKPTTFAELVRISGLSHGTDVWLNNAQELIRSGKAKLNEAICTRDDIMLYLIHMGVDPLHAFTIMEQVRKGKGLKPNDEQAMRAKDVPEWYIESCIKIQYMFPKAHAVAYVTMAFRIAYYKVHYPKAFYIAYFTVRADDFNADLMTHGAQKVQAKIKELEQAEQKLLAKEKNVLTILEVCLEMYRRGIRFLPIDIYKSDAVKFIDVPEGLLPPLNALQGLGESAAYSLVAAREQNAFVSRDDLKVRTKLSQTTIDELGRLGCLEGLPQSSQVTLFD
ncbi:MAG: PolC-type DNA polymerase III, partial [Hyphomonadaceae bacterium]|nr:PolC-type DNA polymerase III [Clostridia bacterium]